MANDFASALSDFGGAVSDLFGARGARSSADSYLSAADIAEQNAQLTRVATGIKETQTSRQIFQTIGAQKAAVGGAGFAESGSALDLLRSSASQGALTKAIVANQGAITENAYLEQAGAFRGMAGAAKSSATAQTIGGLIQGASGVVSLAKGAYNLLGGGGGGGGAATVGSAALEAGGAVGTANALSDVGSMAGLSDSAWTAAGLPVGTAADSFATTALGTTVSGLPEGITGGQIGAPVVDAFSTTAGEAGMSGIAGASLALLPLALYLAHPPSYANPQAHSDYMSGQYSMDELRKMYPGERSFDPEVMAAARAAQANPAPAG